MTGNCFGWLAYAYYSRDPFVLVSNIPGLLVSFWLNAGASKLQYYANVENTDDDDDDDDEAGDEVSINVFTAQDILMLEVLALWMAILVCVGWLGICEGNEKEIIGLLVNINLLFFYAAPLQTMKTVFSEKRSNSIHPPTMILNCTNAGFWGAYGMARSDIVIWGPNSIGMLLGLTQALLCCLFPKNSNQILLAGVDNRPLLDDHDDDSENDGEEDILEVPEPQII
mmetsp:Transcript_36192/g.40273  ORF Transcript_36192/g.40273 Transcript_36192/m.40273 type:complete len:226 (+) Transcript_36192:246-923(+)|eukprot:CAMPEP_0170865332 /NCGR_PEP_ID=MMETSP0734-20130129/21197_1 /TAXON_ID=186038 /ORGANISM="Fragilariopsis kerguelensis, Strain L26-C5" /LENGTH=225 /DNA_ID=CAMNT_0011241485 /DNA_START=485 /DNA_END=1162 /DNA_ORIENTATION=+